MNEFKLGDFVTNGVVEGEIINIHTKYATFVSEGKEYREWIENIVHVDGQMRRNQLYKESLIYKEYKTKNFTRPLSEAFKSITLNNEDEYAVLECLKVFDFILGVNDKTIQEDFNLVRLQTERLKRYSNKTNTNVLCEEFISLVEEELLKYAVLENVKFTTTDTNMIAKVIGMTSGLPDSALQNSSPENTINQAVIKLRNSQLTTQGWELLGRLLNTATKAGIKWNKDTFSNSQQELMKLL